MSVLAVYAVIIVGAFAARFIRLTVGHRWGTRWRVAPTAHVVAVGSLDPVVAPVVSVICGELARLGFDPAAVPTRAVWGRQGGRAVRCFRIAVDGSERGEGAGVEWHQSPARDRQRSVRLTPLTLRLFCYLDGGAYTSVERHVARWSDAVPGTLAVDGPVRPMVGRLLADLRASTDGRPARPRPYADVPGLLSAIDVDAATHTRSWTTTGFRRDRSGTWYVPTWRASVATAATLFFSPRQAAASGARGFEVVPLAT